MGFESKGVLVAILSLVGGVIVGACGGYYFIYPGMVESEIDPINQRLTFLESTLADCPNFCNRLENVETSLGDISRLENRVQLIESEVHEISGIKSDLHTLDNSVSTVEASLSELSQIVSDLQDISMQEDISRLIEISDKLDSLESTINGLESRMNEFIIRVDKNDAYRILRTNLAQPGEYISGQIVDKVFEELQASNNQIIQWISLVGSSQVKSVISSVINSQIPTLVWNSYSISRIKENQYNTYMVTYFPLVIDTGLPIIGEITVAKVGLIMKGTINVITETVSDLQIYSLTI